MRNKNLKNKKAFSLIELSIVILIVGIIVAGVTQSSRMVSAFKLSTARNLTQSSPVASMKNVVLWWETTSTASIKDSEADNGLAVSTWYDINPTSTYKYNATAGTAPTYTTNCMNSLPCLRFNGSSQYLSYDGTFLVGTNFTIFVVEQRRSAAAPNFFMGGTDYCCNMNLVLGYNLNTQIAFAQYSNDLHVTVAGYSAPIPRIHNYNFSTTTGKTHYLNGSLSTFVDSASPTTGITSYNGAQIGKYYTYFFNGDICEIIMFNRVINSEERASIVTYLGKKWGIVVS